MRRCLAFFLLAFWLILPAAAQESDPDYGIRFIRHRFDQDGAVGIVAFEVVNNGGATTETATATLTRLTDNEQLAQATVPSIAPGQQTTVQLRFDASDFEAGSSEIFRASVGIDEVEAANSQTVDDNSAQITITFPGIAPGAELTPEATPEATPEPSASDDPLRPLLQLLNIEQLDLNDPSQVALLAVVIGAALALLLILILILRMIFRRPPDFGSWQPPYANMPPHDPSTIAGVRQQWQPLAQNASLTAVGPDGTVLARKLLMGANGQYLSGWKIVALRISQYDVYGRVARSQVAAPASVISRLNNLVKRRDRLTPEQIIKQARPIARLLNGLLKKKVNERNAMLALALDVRLRGKHGDVRIWFELFRSQYGQWNLIDRWEPEMRVSDKPIDDGFTYTLYGMRTNETIKVFRDRLQDDLCQIVLELVQPAVTSSPATPPPQPGV